MLLRQIIESDPSFRVVGTAADGEEACRIARALKPDLITMDLQMPGMDGFRATQRIMETRPIPILVVSSLVTPDETAFALRAMRAGAVAALPRPPGPGHPEAAARAAGLLDTLRAISRGDVARCLRSRGRKAAPRERPEVREGGSSRPGVVVIGASTGGPHVLADILAAVHPGFSIPLLIVQHITRGFAAGLRDWLDSVSALDVVMGSRGAPVRSGHVYLAPDDAHMGISPSGTIVLARGSPGDLHLPSVSFLFRSARTALGARVGAILLTGMGKDGAEELARLRHAGAPTVIQDRSSSVVWGMPGEANRLGAASLVLSPPEIVAWLHGLDTAP